MKRVIILLLLISILPLMVQAATELSGSSYRVRHGVVSLAGPGASSSTYQLDNVIGVNASSMSGTLYGMSAGLYQMNSLPEAAIASYNGGATIEDETPTLEWTYTDADNDTQKKYQLQVGHEGFATPTVDTGEISTAGTSYTTPILPRTEERTVYTWRVRVHDGYGWSGWQTASSGFVLTKGEFVITGLGALTRAGGAAIRSSTWQMDNDPYFYWEAPGTGLEVNGYSLDIDVLPDDTIDTTDTYYSYPQDSIADGTHTFYVAAQRSSGVWGDAVSFSLYVDTAAPSISNLSPTLGGVSSNDTPQIRATFSDAGSGVDPESIELRVNQARVTASVDAETGVISYTPSTPLSDGEVTVSLEGEDLVGNEAVPVTWSFTIDTTGPTGSLVINNDDPVTTTNTVTLAITAEDDVTSAAQMMLSNDGVFDTEAWETFASLRRNWVMPAVAGLRKVYVRIKDEAGNISDIYEDDINLVIIAPDTYILTGPSGVTAIQDAEFYFRASLVDSMFSYKFDNNDWSAWSESDSVTTTGLEEGNHYFMVRAAKDLNGDSLLQLDEVDPTPALRVWTISITGRLQPPAEPEVPIKRWEEE